MEEHSVRDKFFEVTNNYIKNKKVSHAYLIEVSNYEQDFFDVLNFVKMLLCDCSKEDLINKKNNICTLIDDGNYPDLKIIEADGQWIKKNQMLELMDEFQNKSLLDNKKIYIIKEAEKLNNSSANTILKFLEEPEEGIIAILLTKNRFQVIETILSRCQFLNLSTESVGNDLSSDSRMLFEYILNGNDLFINYSNIVSEIIPDKVVAKRCLNEISQVIINYLAYMSNKDYALSMEFINILNGQNVEKLVNIIAIIEEEIKKLEYNINYKLWLDNLFAQIILGG